MINLGYLAKYSYQIQGTTHFLTGYRYTIGEDRPRFTNGSVVTFAPLVPSREWLQQPGADRAAIQIHYDGGGTLTWAGVNGADVYFCSL